MSIGKRLRFEILKRDGFRCSYCGATPDVSGLHVDHIIPRANGGTDEPANLTASCQSCNSGKSDRELHETSGAVSQPVSVAITRARQTEELLRAQAAVADSKRALVDSFLGTWNRRPPDTVVGAAPRLVTEWSIDDLGRAISATETAWARLGDATSRAKYFFGCLRVMRDRNEVLALTPDQVLERFKAHVKKGGALVEKDPVKARTELWNAIRLANNGLSVDPDTLAEVRFKLGLAQFNCRAFGDSFTTFRDLWELGYATPRSAFNAAVSALSEGDMETAMEYASTAHEEGMEEAASLVERIAAKIALAQQAKEDRRVAAEKAAAEHQRIADEIRHAKETLAIDDACTMTAAIGRELPAVLTTLPSVVSLREILASERLVLIDRAFRSVALASQVSVVMKSLGWILDRDINGNRIYLAAPEAPA